MSTELVALESLHAEIILLVAPFSKYEVVDFAGAARAIEALKELKGITKRVDITRRTLVDPLNDEVKSINAFAKTVEAPLLEAEKNLKNQIVQFETAQERVRAEKQRLADLEAAKIAEELRARQSAEADRAQEAAGLFGDDSESEAVKSELAEKHTAERSEAFNAKSTADWEIDQLRIRNTRKTWKCALVDINLVPEQFVVRTLNEKAVLAYARGNRDDKPVVIAGVSVWQETGLAVGMHTYVSKHVTEQ